MARVRAELQAKGTKSAKRKLKKRARREARHATHTNHAIAKSVVDVFCCVVCGLAGPADHIAAVNVRARARTAWVLVNAPHAAVSPPFRQGLS
jgi:hypothetical protein